MDLTVDLRQPFKETVGSLEPSHLWVLGLTVDDDSSFVGRTTGQNSYSAECECPDDCLRDHENE
jgi:hypothetical protein